MTHPLAAALSRVSERMFEGLEFESEILFLLASDTLAFARPDGKIEPGFRLLKLLGGPSSIAA